MGAPTGVRTKTAPRREVVIGCLILGVGYAAIVAGGFCLFARYGMLLVLNAALSILFVGWAWFQTQGALFPEVYAKKGKPASVPMRLLSLMMAGAMFCIAITLIYDMLSNPLFPGMPYGGGLLRISYRFMNQLLILVPVPYAFFAFVAAERWKERQAQKRVLAP